jgi:integrase
MPRLKANEVPRHVPHHGADGKVRGRVWMSGRYHYTGDWGSDEAAAKYLELTARWLANGRRLPRWTGDMRRAVTVADLCDAYLGHARSYYGDGSSHVVKAVAALQGPRALYGSEDAGAVGVSEWETLQRHWVRRGLCRATVNVYGRLLRECYRWAYQRGTVPAESYWRLRDAPMLAKGRGGAVDRPKAPVPTDDAIEAVASSLEETGDRHLGAMVRLQRLTGMRPGEVCRITPGEVDRSGAVWLYRPTRHKTEYRDGTRVVPIGPRAQAVLGPWLDRCAAPDAPAFSTRDRGEEPCCPNLYYLAVTRAARRCGVTLRPNLLRHAAATAIRKALGLEAAQHVLGHTQARMTEVYARRGVEAAIKVAAELG